MFNFLKKQNKNCEVYSPCNGRSISIEDVPDKMFAAKLLGDGIGFIFEGDTLYAPIDGTITMVANTKHAIGFTSKNGVELLLHVGLDTVNLNGEGLEVFVKQNQKIKHGEAVLKVDKKLMERKNVNLTTPMVITNMKDYDITITHLDEDVITSDIMITAMKKRR